MFRRSLFPALAGLATAPLFALGLFAACMFCHGELARLKPADLDALRHIYGVGEKKARDLGDRVLEVIRGSGT